jgi:hypothetical protein
MSGSAQAQPTDEQQWTTWDVHRIAYTHDQQWAFARITAHLPRRGGDTRIEQTLAFRFDDHGLISHIEVFWRDPRS